MARPRSTLGYPDVRAVPVYVYGLADPRSGHVRYIGKSSAPTARVMNHRIVGASAVRAWLDELRRAGLKPRVEVLKIVPAGKDADWYETKAIEEHVRKHDAIAPLLNSQLRPTPPGRERTKQVRRASPIGDRLSWARETSGLSARELGRLAGLGHSHVSMIEDGSRVDVGADVAARLARVLGVSLDWLIAGKGPIPSLRTIRRAVSFATDAASR